MENWVSHENDTFRAWAAVIGKPNLDNPFVVLAFCRKAEAAFPICWSWRLYEQEVDNKIKRPSYGSEKDRQDLVDAYLHIYKGTRVILKALRDNFITNLVENNQNEEARRYIDRWRHDSGLQVGKV